MRVRKINRMMKNGRNRRNGTRQRVKSRLKPIAIALTRSMIIEKFIQEPLRLDRKEAVKLADEMVRIAAQNRTKANDLNLP